jgi:hypothetical protein
MEITAWRIPDGSVERCKGSLVAKFKGFQQQHGLGYQHVLAPAGRPAACWILLAFAVQHDLDILFSKATGVQDKLNLYSTFFHTIAPAAQLLELGITR